MKKYVFIIDEINRGEISKIFGELFFAVDPGYRGVAGEVSTSKKAALLMLCIVERQFKMYMLKTWILLLLQESVSIMVDLLGDCQGGVSTITVQDCSVN